MEFPLVHHLSYSWSGWPMENTFPPDPEPAFLDDLRAAWVQDGLDLQHYDWRPAIIQMAFLVEPDAAPSLFAGRVKGRLQHALRQAGRPTGFSRKVAVRALGDTISPAVEGYLQEQTARAELADERYRATLKAAAFVDDAVDLSQPAETKSGRYWFNLHLVAVTEDRFRIGKEDFLPKVRAGVFAWAAETGCRLKAFSPMPDHVHVAARGDPERSPRELGEALWRNLNRAAGCRLMSDRVYAGTFSEYGLGAILKGS
ncbi:MAG: transposase [Kiritimatiellae bacterium]|nr:transposase [Kiritimatiellia bacterium]